MITFPESKRTILAILSGLMVILFIGIFHSMISFFMISHILSDNSINEFKSISKQQPYLAFSWLLKLMSLITPLIGGFVVGRIVKNKGWLYAGFLGVTIVLLSIILYSLSFILPSNFISNNPSIVDLRQSSDLKKIVKQLIYSPITIILIGFGGYLSDMLNKRSQSKKSKIREKMSDH